MREVEISEFLAALRQGVANASLYPADHPQTALAVDVLVERLSGFLIELSAADIDERFPF